MFAVGNAELEPFFRQIDDLSRQVEAARVAILGEALAEESSRARTARASRRG
jgi:hypothetical protein